MTTFEIIVTVAIIAIVVLKILEFTGMATTYVKTKEGFEYLGKKIEGCDSKLGYIKGTAQDISQQLDNIEDNNDQDNKEIKTLLGSLVNLRFNEEGLKSGINPPTGFLYCATPDGVCTNPYGDCINCPKRGTGGTWSTNTSIKAEDAPLQERFNDNKDD